MLKKSYPDIFDADIYGVLQVSPRARQEVIDAAYRALMKIHAPRVSGDSEKTARLINEAYQLVSKPTDRRDYNEYLASKGDGLIGPYRKVSKIASGGFGTTFKAQHTRNGKFSCIKECSEISPEAEAILTEETNALWDLRHFGLPVMKDLIKLDDGSLALAMSWIEGPTLEQIIEKHHKLDPEHVAWIAERILNTLSYLHHHQVLHGDIKPQNIIVQPDTHIVVLVDFGLSAVKPTMHTAAKGYTELFSPPEQMPGSDKPLLPGSDFYSLGMTMIYALTGDVRRVQAKQIPSSVPKPMERFIYSLVRHNVLERPDRAGELFDEFIKVRIESFGREHSGMKPFPVTP